MSANSWFRMYYEFAHDPKIQRMSEADQRRFIMLLCLRCSNGDVTLHDSDVAFQLRISNEEWQQSKAVFIDKNLIDEDNKPTAWDKRQFASDSSAVRVSKHRAMKKEASNGGVTLQKRKSNALDTDTDTDTDTEVKEYPSQATDTSAGSKKTKSPAVVFKTFIAACKEAAEKPIPENDPVFSFADETGIPEDFLFLAWCEFRSRYLDSSKRYSDWRKVFRNAVRGNWFKLWYVDDAGQVCLTSNGRLLQQAHREAA